MTCTCVKKLFSYSYKTHSYGAGSNIEGTNIERVGTATLPHWGLVTHIYVGNLTIVFSDRLVGAKPVSESTLK